MTLLLWPAEQRPALWYRTSQQIHPSERNHVVEGQHRRAFCPGQYASISEKSRTYTSLLQEQLSTFRFLLSTQ